MKDFCTKASVDKEMEKPVEPHRAGWLQRIRGWMATDPREWKASKWARMKCFSLCVTIDHMLRTFSAWCGLAHFVVDPGQDPLERPCFSVAVDQGSDNVAALNFLTRHLSLNIDPVWDPAHGAWNDMRRALKACGMWPHELLFILSHNMRFGPWLQEQRFRQIIEAGQTYVHYMTPGTCPYWSFTVRHIVRP